MGTIEKGILAAVSGKVGNVVGAVWKGIPTLRSLQGSKKGSPSDLQLAQQAKFSLLGKFLQPLTPLLNQTFDRVTVGMSGFNKAFSYNIHNAITGGYPDFGINFPTVLISRGDLPSVRTVAAVSSAVGKLTVSWTDISGLGKTRSTDKAIVAAYSDELKHWVYYLGTVTRNAATYTVDLSMLSGRTVHVYLGFLSADGRLASNSLYAGLVNVQ